MVCEFLHLNVLSLAKHESIMLLHFWQPDEYEIAQHCHVGKKKDVICIFRSLVPSTMPDTSGFLFILFYFIYLFMTVLGLRSCTQVFSCGERGLLFIAVGGFLMVVASFVAEHSF